MEDHKYSDDKLSILQNLFNTADSQNAGFILINQLPGLLSRIGKGDDEIVAITEQSTKIAPDGRISFDNFRALIDNSDNESETNAPYEGADPKVLEFCRILEEYRVKCEEEGNYLEAARALKQLGVLRSQEEKRQQKAVRARQISERQDVQLAHNMQFSDFNASWDNYMDDYDNMAQMYIQQMTERHAVVLLEFQKELREELASKPPKWSRELLEWRRRQHMLARRKNYAEAQKIKKIADKAEEKERAALEEQQAILFARKESKFRAQQQAELQALLKRIEVRRKEHIKQREMDSKRLLQRNRNVQAVLESKQAVESHRVTQEIKKNLFNTSGVSGGDSMMHSGGDISTRNSTMSNTAGSKKAASRSKGLSSSDPRDAEKGDFMMVDDRDPPFMSAAVPALKAGRKRD
eukprot:CAMPEP_0182427950 /NCGR_PEP_ID=MMETSP1167-20130531/20913_1 /TAXON_ID=2988 /ORGANISM="Mallomonas Sp, Strain CCMP3275" /LENGTH=407 /DNA_ID=CAMNT_0024610557 /DNA_START=86 /DNA_END=1309 /DNA_ORIENTATION=-